MSVQRRSKNCMRNNCAQYRVKERLEDISVFKDG